MLKLVPKTQSAPSCSDGERLLSALNLAVADTQRDMALGKTARGVAIIFLHEDEGYVNESWIIEGMNCLEATGLLHMALTDLSANGITGPRYEGHDPNEPAPAA